MIDTEYIELIHREIDGVASHEESVRLRRYLAANEAARSYYEEMVKLANVLSEVKAVEPPESLRRDVMASVLERQGRKDRERRARVARFLSGLSLRWRYASCLAAGLAVGLCAFAIYLGASHTRPQLQKTDASGTLLSRVVSGEFAATDRQPFDVGGAQGVAEIRSNETTSILDLQISAQETADVLIDFVPAQLGLLEFSREQSAGGPVLSGAGRMQIHHAGANRYRIAFHREVDRDALVRVQILAREIPLDMELHTSTKRP